MARKSDMTGKGPLAGNRRSHALNANKRVWNLNLQKVKVADPETGKVITVRMTAKELKTMKRREGLR